MVLRRVFLALSPLVGLGVVAWIGIRADVSLAQVVGSVPSQAHLWALAAFLLSLLGRSARISLLARGLGRQLSLPRAMGVQLAGEAAAAATPSRSGSDPARLLVMRRHGVDIPTGFAVLVGEMVAEGIVLLVVMGALVAFLPENRVIALAALPYAVAALAFPFVAVLPVRVRGGLGSTARRSKPGRHPLLVAMVHLLPGRHLRNGFSVLHPRAGQGLGACF